jgi:hypothetical protein
MRRFSLRTLPLLTGRASRYDCLHLSASESNKMLTAMRVGAQLGTRAVETVAPTFTEWMASRSLALLGKAAERTGFGESTVARWSAKLESGTPSVSKSAEETVDVGRRKFLSYGGAAAATAAVGNPLKLLGSGVMETIMHPIGAVERLLAAGSPITAANRAAALHPYIETLIPQGVQTFGPAIRGLGRYASGSVTGGTAAEADLAAARFVQTIGHGEARAVHEIWLQTEGFETGVLPSAMRIVRPAGGSAAQRVAAGETAAEAEASQTSLTMRPIQQVISGRVATAEQASVRSETTALSRGSGETAVQRAGLAEAPSTEVAKATEVRMLTHTETPAAIDSLAKNSAVRNGANAERTEIEAQIR